MLLFPLSPTPFPQGKGEKVWGLPPLTPAGGCAPATPHFSKKLYYYIIKSIKRDEKVPSLFFNVKLYARVLELDYIYRAVSRADIDFVYC